MLTFYVFLWYGAGVEVGKVQHIRLGRRETADRDWFCGFGECWERLDFHFLYWEAEWIVCSRFSWGVGGIELFGVWFRECCRCWEDENRVHHCILFVDRSVIHVSRIEAS